MLKGLLGGMASASRSMTGMGGSGKGSGSLKKEGLAGILNRKKVTDEVHRNSSGDKELPLSGSPNPEHRAIARRRMAATPRPKPNMEEGKKKGIFSRLMEMKQKYNPLDRATAPLGKNQSSLRPRSTRYNA